MKKIIVAILTLAMLVAMLVPVSAADVTIKDYKDAANGELLYTVNFAGDNVFKPKGLGKADTSFDFIPSADGTSIDVKAKENCAESGATSNWGAIIKELPAGKGYTYTFTYKVKANGAGVNNKLGIGAWINNKMAVNHINCYGNYNAPQAEGEEAFENSICLEAGSTKYNTYVTLASVGEYDETDGFLTVMITYDGAEDKIDSYLLAKGAAGDKAEDWLKVESAKMGLNAIADCMGFMFYCHYAAVDMTVKDAKIYKGFIIEVPEETKPETTKKPAPTLPAETTPAPVETTPVETEPAAGGCGGTVTFAGLALVAALGTCAVFTSKKRRG